jgi:hypothetical protein
VKILEIEYFVFKNKATAYKKSYAITFVRNETLRVTSNASTQATECLSKRGLVNISILKVIQSLLPSSLCSVVSLLIAPVQTNGLCKPQLSG